MSDIMQWVIVGIVILVSAIYLIRRLKPSQKGCGCDGNCNGCNMSTDIIERCRESSKHTSKR